MRQNVSPALAAFESRYYRAELACTALSDLMNNGEDTPSVSRAWAEIKEDRDRMRHQIREENEMKDKLWCVPVSLTNSYVSAVLAIAAPTANEAKLAAEGDWIGIAALTDCKAVVGEPYIWEEAQ